MTASTRPTIRSTTTSRTIPPIHQEPKIREEGGLWAIGGLRAGNLSIVEPAHGGGELAPAAKGTKVAVYQADGLAIYDSDHHSEARRSARLRGYGYSSNVLVSGRPRDPSPSASGVSRRSSTEASAQRFHGSQLFGAGAGPSAIPTSSERRSRAPRATSPLRGSRA